jgi:DNA-binding NtrC family response regulator
VLREGQRAEGQELGFIVRSLVELKLQVEELRRRLDDERTTRAAVDGPSRDVVGAAAPGLLGAASALEARDPPPPPNVVTVTPGMTMAEIERAAIEAALRETGGNRRRAAELLGIGERTLYRKLHEYEGGPPDGEG